MASLEAPEYVTIAQAAESIASKPWPLIEAAKSGLVQSVRYGEVLLVSADAVERHAEQLRGMVLATPEAIERSRCPCE